MSFLAQLREKYQAQTHSLQLCYLLRVTDNALHVSLRLAHLIDGRIKESVQAYVPQPSHFVTPPTFLKESDQPVVKFLVQFSHEWTQQSEGELPAEVAVVLLPMMLKTKKAFWSNNLSSALVWEAPLTIKPVWNMDSSGQQTLEWRGPEHSTLYRLGMHFLVCRTPSLHLGRSIAFDPTELTNLSISPLNVANFLYEQGARWRSLGLPLPESVLLIPQPAILKAVIVLDPSHWMQKDRFGRQQRLDCARLMFRYISNEVCSWRSVVDAPEPMTFVAGQGVKVIQPQVQQEQAALAEARRLMLQPLGDDAGRFQEVETGCWLGSAKITWQQWVLHIKPQLLAAGFDVQVLSGFRHDYVLPVKWEATIHNTGDNWGLDLVLEMEGGRVDLPMLLEQLKQLNRASGPGMMEIPLGEKLLLIPGHMAQALAEELDALASSSRKKTRQHVPTAQLYRLTALRRLLQGNVEWSGDVSLLQRAEALQDSPVLLDIRDCPINAELRPYQWLGVCWIQHLKRLGFNGLLADDMGLGKTLQTLAHLSLEQRQGALTQPALIVAPTSLLSNWARELQRFCPHLTLHVVHGASRKHRWPAKEPHIYITSYHLLARDIEMWSGQSLSWVVLDEAQIIKNPSTQISSAVRELKAQHRLCLSGTPVENHLGELWALMDFLQPGVLGTQTQFRSYYQKPIEQEGRRERFDSLLQRIGPLMLRRTKNQVAQDLPPKTVMQQLIPLSESQQAFYQRVKRDDWQLLEQRLNDTDNAGQRQILVLTALMRLRQACCDPALLGETEMPSAKTEHCLEMLQSLVAEGRSVLVFSQFTQMLDILSQRLEVNGIAHLTLTGQTAQRSAIVDAFQEGQAPVLLISLKAGGVGLNLTRADTVIHFDPWWNSAAEEQASDRAHRIGQTQPVFVYKLIAEGTVEEKIASLQQSKAQLSDQVNQQAQDSGRDFAVKLEQLLDIWQDDERLELESHAAVPDAHHP